MLEDSSGLVIDRDVRNWVLIPLTVSVLLLLLLRQYASVLLTGQSSGGEAQDENDVRQKAILDRCKVMKATSGLLTPSGFHQRIRYFTDQVSIIVIIIENHSFNGSVYPCSRCDEPRA